jgi:hypothetical protein
MQVTVTREEPRKVAEAYLGFEIRWSDGKCMAIPMGWHAEPIHAESLPELRKKIWRFWHQV